MDWMDYLNYKYFLVFAIENINSLYLVTTLIRETVRNNEWEKEKKKEE